MRIGSDYKEATERLTSFAFREGPSVEYVPKEERLWTDALDPRLEKLLIWSSKKLAYLFCQRRIILKFQFVHFLELQFVDSKCQVVLEWRRLERPQMVFSQLSVSFNHFFSRDVSRPGTHPHMFHPPSLLFLRGHFEFRFRSSPAPPQAMTFPRSVSTPSSPRCASPLSDPVSGSLATLTTNTVQRGQGECCQWEVNG